AMGLPFRGVNLRELPPISRPGGGPPVGLRVVGYASLTAIFGSVLLIDPKPGLHGDGPLVALGFLALALGIAGSLPRRALPDGQRLVALLLATAGTCVLAAV